MSSLLQLGDLSLKMTTYDSSFVILKRTQEADSLTSLAKQIFENKYNFIEEVIGTPAEILLKVNDKFTSDSLSQLELIKNSNPVSTNSYRLPIIFSEVGDWELVEKSTGLNRTDYQGQLLGPFYTLAMLGFLPGFLYLDGLPSALHVPRKTDPAQRLTAGSLAVGGQYLGFYSLPSPGGWNVLGHSPIKMLDTTALPPVALHPGDTIQLQVISDTMYQALLSKPLSLTEYNELF